MSREAIQRLVLVDFVDPPRNRSGAIPGGQKIYDRGGHGPSDNRGLVFRRDGIYEMWRDGNTFTIRDTASGYCRNVGIHYVREWETIDQYDAGVKQSGREPVARGVQLP